MLHSQTYNNCIRTEKGYCKIQWKESSSTAPDPFQVGAGTTIDGTACTEFINIPNLSPDGVLPIPVPAGEVQYQNENCGSGFGIPNTVSAPTAVPITLTCKQLINGTLYSCCTDCFNHKAFSATTVESIKMQQFEDSFGGGSFCTYFWGKQNPNLHVLVQILCSGVLDD